MNNILLDPRYEIRKQLSKKAGRRTFLAQDLHSQNLVIIKILLFDQDFQWDELKLFEREPKTLQNLAHPGIPEYLDYFEVNDGVYHGFALVQTYIDAPSLDMLIQQGQNFSEKNLIEIADKLLSILHYLHGQLPAVIHRDIKPSNILLANRSGNNIGDIYLVDFGSVQTAASKNSGTITIVGSYGYIPLEQFGGQAVPASDLYSLGMTIIYLATGTHPAELPQVNGKIKFSTPQLSKQFQKWLDKMIQPYLERRFDSAKVAQGTLKSPDGSFGNYPELKPKDTTVQLQRDGERMEIILKYPLSFRRIIPYKTIIKFLITSDKIYGYDAWGKEQLTNLRSEISLLAYSPSYSFDRFWDDGVQIRKIVTKPELNIYAGATKYSIASIANFANISAAELLWIGQELSEFLDLELKIFSPTAKVPPEQNSPDKG